MFRCTAMIVSGLGCKESIELKPVFFVPAFSGCLCARVCDTHVSVFVYIKVCPCVSLCVQVGCDAKHVAVCVFKYML